MFLGNFTDFAQFFLYIWKTFKDKKIDPPNYHLHQISDNVEAIFNFWIAQKSDHRQKVAEQNQ